jgi:hypothetical protein
MTSSFDFPTMLSTRITRRRTKSEEEEEEEENSVHILP